MPTTSGNTPKEGVTISSGTLPKNSNRAIPSNPPSDGVTISSAVPRKKFRLSMNSVPDPRRFGTDTDARDEKAAYPNIRPESKVNNNENNNPSLSLPRNRVTISTRERSNESRSNNADSDTHEHPANNNDSRLSSTEPRISVQFGPSPANSSELNSSDSSLRPTPVIDIDDIDHYFAKRVKQAEKIAQRPGATAQDQQNLADCLVAYNLYESERNNIKNRRTQADGADADYNTLSIRASQALMQRLVDDWHNAKKPAEAHYMQRLNQLGFIEMVLKKNEALSINAGRADDMNADGIGSIGSHAAPEEDKASSQVVAASIGRDEVFLAVKSFQPASQQAPEDTKPAQDVTVKLMGEKGKISNMTDRRAFNTLSEDDKNKVAMQQARMYLMKYYKPGQDIVIRGTDPEYKARLTAALQCCLSYCKTDLDNTRIVGATVNQNVVSSFSKWISEDNNKDNESLVAVVNQRTTKEALGTMRGTIYNNQFVNSHEPSEPLDGDVPDPN